MTPAPAQTTEVTLAVADDKIVMVLSSPSDGSLGVSMTTRDADKLAGRLRKAACDARAARARQRGTT